jgi:O-acetyl-ADP-ribose deacetylase (regulator of RNase III)
MYKTQINWKKEGKSSATVNYDFKVEVVCGDITDEHTDAIVNPANEKMAHSGGCAAAILREAGAELQNDSMNYINVHGELKVG